MRMLNGRVILEHTHIRGFTEREFINDATSSFIPNPVSLRIFKENWAVIKQKESYTKELLNEIGLYSDLSFRVRDEDIIKEVRWLESFDQDEYQVNATIEMLNRYRLAIFFDTGTGKTVIAANYLYNRLDGKKNWNILIITLANVVSQYEFDLSALPEEMRVDNTIAVRSYDQAYKELETSWDVIILDESHSAKNKSTLRYEDIKELIPDFTPFVFLMTATPQDKSKYEIIVQLSILSNKFLHSMGASAFKQRYFVVDEYGNPTMDYRAHIEEVEDMIRGISIAAKAEDVLDIPPIHTHLIQAPNSAPFKQMLYKKYLHLEDKVFVGDNSSKYRSYLREISNGFIYENYVSNPEADMLKWKVSKRAHRLNKVKQAMLYKLLTYGHDIPNKDGITFTHMDPPETAIIYTFFDEDNRMIEDVLKSVFVTYENVYKLTKKKRDQLVLDFKNGEYNFLIIKAGSGGAGLNLQRCNNVIWYTMPQAWIAFKQGNGRVHRRGQERVQGSFVLLASSLDKDIYKMVAIEKKSYTDASFDLFVNMATPKGE